MLTTLSEYIYYNRTKTENASFFVADISVGIVENSLLISLNLSETMNVEFKCIDSALYAPPAMISAKISGFSITGRTDLLNSNR